MTGQRLPSYRQATYESVAHAGASEALVLVAPSDASRLCRLLGRSRGVAKADSFDQLIDLMNRCPGGAVVVDPGMPDFDELALSDALRRSGALAVFATRLTRSGARALLCSLSLKPHGLLLLPYDDTGRIEDVVSGGESHSWQVSMLLRLWPDLMPAPDELLRGIIAAFRGYVGVDSVKTLAGFCGVNERTVRRWFGALDLVAERIVVSARLTRGRAALANGMSDSAAARVGYSRAAVLWRAVRSRLSLGSSDYRRGSPDSLAPMLLALAKEIHRDVNA